jgi:hypothetical protein
MIVPELELRPIARNGLSREAESLKKYLVTELRSDFRILYDLPRKR